VVVALVLVWTIAAFSCPDDLDRFGFEEAAVQAGYCSLSDSIGCLSNTTSGN